MAFLGIRGRNGTDSVAEERHDIEGTGADEYAAGTLGAPRTDPEEGVGDLTGVTGEGPTEPIAPRRESPRRRPRSRAGTPRTTARMRGAIVLAILVLVLGVVAAVLVSSPSSTVTSPGTAEATVGSIRATVQLTGAVVQETTQGVPAPVTGTITSLDVRPGDSVAAGDDIATITVASVAPSPTFSLSSPAPTPSPTGISESVTAPIAGTIGALLATKNQTVVAGQQVVTIIPSRFDVIAAVPQNEMYRFYTAPLSVQVTIPHQDQPVDCTFVSVGGNVPKSGATQALTTEVDFRCQLPDGTAVFPGVQVTVTAVTAEVDDAVTLPVSAVQRSGNSGTVWLVEKGHAPVRKEVTTGIVGDGRIQIVSGLFAGQTVLDPASPPPTP